MIENYETDDFERTLKEHADRFILIPSERVWNSIYNDLHPGSRWPSLTAGLFMLLLLIWVGNMSRSNNDRKAVPAQQTTRLAPPQTGAVTPLQWSGPTTPDRSHTTPDRSSNRNTRSLKTSQVHAHIAAFTPPARMIGGEAHVPADGGPISESTATPGRISPAEREGDALPTYPAGLQLSNEFIPPASSIAGATSRRDKKTAAKPASGERRVTSFRKNLKWEFFLNPMISNVHFGGANLNKTGSAVTYTPVSNHSMDISKKLGFITGMRTFYPLTKKLSLTTGAQVIYTGYNIYSEVMMPNIASLTFKDSKGKMFSKNYVSYYANEKKGGKTNITNYNWQLSVPMGIKWDFFSNPDIKLSVISTVEPFLVVGSKAYLLSGDASSYVMDPDLVRKFNMSGNVGTVISFESDHAEWKVGPNVRYQILSTYSNIYPVREHFISYGIQVGVRKK